LVINTSFTNYWPDITTTVPMWGTDRRFDPTVPHPGWTGTGYPDYDRLYSQITGQAGDFFDDYSEYRISEFAQGPDTLFPVVRLFPPPGNPPWASNPFMWDTDGDGLPDGWEVSFGYDPWRADSNLDGVRDGNENPDGVQTMASTSTTTSTWRTGSIPARAIVTCRRFPHLGRDRIRSSM